MTPAISVIMACYNGGPLVTETLESVRAQTFGDFELIAVDDCSTDDTLAVLNAFDDPRLRVIAAEVNQGPVHTRNRAFDEARGRYIVGLDQDDLCHPERFARQAAYLDAHPEVVLVASAAALLEDGKIAPWPGPRDLTPPLIDWLLMVRNPLVWSSVMFRADAARRLDPFERPELRYAEDFDLYQRLRAFGRLARLDDELAVYRCHAGGASQRFRTAMGESATKVLAERYTPVLGSEAAEAAGLVAAHLMAREPVADADVLDRLFGFVERLHAHFLVTTDPAPADRKRIEREYSRLWWQVTRTALRTHPIGLWGAIAARPKGVRVRPQADMLVSPLVGHARALGRSFGGLAKTGS